MIPQPYMPEALIEIELGAMWIACNEGKQEEAQAHWARVKELIAQRSPQQVARMERERGLT